ncbi:MAG TPA: sigma-54 dependent transcriptional regulator [Candidatus Acidoferrales bacterium]|nr:sigma-54 dependent transcriptional regulator [Candidatus Acidoferrales bacterium]
MMSKEATRVWFSSPAADFAEAVVRALGPEFEVQRSREFSVRRLSELEEWWDVVLLDLRATALGDATESGLRFLEELLRIELVPPIVAIVDADEHVFSLNVIEKGAYDVVASPPNMIELRLILRRADKFHRAEREAQQLRAQQQQGGRLHELIGASESMQQVFALAQKIAACDVTVLVTGETGTGKELLARAIHRMSQRASRPFVAFSCANLPETLVEDELFGHEKGAFTGAFMTRRGRLEAASGGTLFLDEVGDLSLSLQPKMLRVLQERTFERLGSNTPVQADIRLVCATHRNVAEMVQQGKFREDLYYRLDVVQLHLPPLRQRRDDIPLLAHYFLQRFGQQFGRKPQHFSRPVLQAMEEYSWPGNVRELENIVQRAVVLAEGPTIEVWHLPALFHKSFEPAAPRAQSYEAEVREFKRRLILRTLEQCGWHKTEAARTLGMARNYLHRLINQLEIQPEAEEPPEESPPKPFPSDRLM